LPLTQHPVLVRGAGGSNPSVGAGVLVINKREGTTSVKTLTKKRRETAEVALDAARVTQTADWRSLSMLEVAWRWKSTGQPISETLISKIYSQLIGSA
jgi:hypothetical protein